MVQTFPLRWSILLLLLAALALGLYLWAFRDLPSPEDLNAFTTAPSSKIYDRNGRLLFEMPPPYTGSHTPVPLDEIPEALIQATIALEDEDFYTNPGFDLRGIMRAVWYDLNLDEDARPMGGSTLTQQLVRNLMLSPGERYEQTLRRKVREAFLAVRVTARYSKDEILAFYLNETYYGNLAYGVEAAAQAYYGKHVRDLDLAECAMLAVLPQAPALWNPLEHFEDAAFRQSIVLDRMVAEGYVAADAADLARSEKLDFAAAPLPIRAPHFVMYVRGLLEQEIGLERLQAGGLEIHTTLDLDLNEAARDMMRYRLDQLAVCDHDELCPPGGYNVRNAAVVALDPSTGEVLAMVGSPDYFSARIDGAVNGTTALRQPGSSIKPITYAAAFADAWTSSRSRMSSGSRMTPATVMMDVRTSFVTREGTPYVPLNYDLTFRGPVRLREALASSYNVVAVKVLDAVGIEAMTSMARQMGITTFDDPDRIGLAVALGGGEVRLLELAAAYAALANGGYAVAPQVVRSVTDADGHVIWQRPCDSPAACLQDRVLDARVAYQLTDILSDDQARIPTFGEDSVLNLTRPAAVKTGTTTDFRDNWTVGYTPDLVVGVWVGNADSEPMKGVTGVTGAAPLWRDVMEAAHKGLPVHAFVRPDGLVAVEVCALSGELPNPDCPHTVTELFLEGTEPTTTCEMHQRIGDQVYVVLPPEAQAWGREHGIPQPPTDDRVSAPEAGLILTSPDTGAVYRIDPTLPPAQQKIRIAAAAGVALDRATLLVDGVPFAEFDAPPYEALWTLTEGTHRFQARGIDAQGEDVMSGIVEVTVQP